MKFTHLACLFLTLLTTMAVFGAEPAPPNKISLLADNMGYGDAAFNGEGRLETLYPIDTLNRLP